MSELPVGSSSTTPDEGGECWCTHPSHVGPCRVMVDLGTLSARLCLCGGPAPLGPRVVVGHPNEAEAEQPHVHGSVNGIGCGCGTLADPREPGGFTLHIHVPPRCPDDQVWGITNAAVDAAMEAEPPDRDGWDIEVWGHSEHCENRFLVGYIDTSELEAQRDRARSLAAHLEAEAAQDEATSQHAFNVQYDMAEQWRKRFDAAEARLAAIQALCDEAEERGRMHPVFGGAPSPGIVMAERIRAVLAGGVVDG